MKISAIRSVAVAACLVLIFGGAAISAQLAEAFLGWSVSPGSFANGIWTIPGETTVTASVVNEFGEPITEGKLVWQTCGGTGLDLGTHHPAADCQQSGSVRWRDAVIVMLNNPLAIRPCFCAGDQQGFRLLYRGSRGGDYASKAGKPFDLFAETSCPRRIDC